MRHIENVLQVDAVLDASFLSSFRRQVGEPDDGNPVLQVRRADVLEHLPLLRSHETCRRAHRTSRGETCWFSFGSISLFLPLKLICDLYFRWCRVTSWELSWTKQEDSGSSQSALQLSESCSNWQITNRSLGSDQDTYRKQREQPGRMWTPSDIDHLCRDSSDTKVSSFVTVHKHSASPASTTCSMVGKRLQTAVLTERKMRSDVRLT